MTVRDHLQSGDFTVDNNTAFVTDQKSQSRIVQKWSGTRLGLKVKVKRESRSSFFI